MALNINTNMGALMASAAASSVNKEMGTSMERLSTGMRINTAADDAAGVAIASRLTNEVRGTNQAIRNALDAQAMIDTAEGAMNEITALMTRMRELAVQAANDTNDDNDRAALQAEMTQLTQEIDRISAVTTWAGQDLLNGLGGTGGNGQFTFQIGSGTSASANQLSVTIASVTSDGLTIDGDDVASADFASTATTTGDGAATDANGSVTIDGAWAEDDTIAFAYDGETVTLTILATEEGDGAATWDAIAVRLADAINNQNWGITAAAAQDGTGVITLKEGSLDISSASAALTTITALDTALTSLATTRAQLGSVSNRLDSTVANMTNVVTNLEAGRSRIQDADFATESTNLAKTQILQQASVAMLAQANASKQGVLQLLQG